MRELNKQAIKTDAIRRGAMEKIGEGLTRGRNGWKEKAGVRVAMKMLLAAMVVLCACGAASAQTAGTGAAVPVSAPLPDLAAWLTGRPAPALTAAPILPRWL